MIYVTIPVEQELPDIINREYKLWCIDNGEIAFYTFEPHSKKWRNDEWDEMHPTHWLKPVTTLAELIKHCPEVREEVVKLHEQSCKVLLKSISDGFIANQSKVEAFSDKAVFQAIGETIETFPTPVFQTVWEQYINSILNP